MTGRVLHGQLHFLDRQIVSRRDGRLVGKVDDLEIDVTSEVPYVSALLTGPSAWGARLPGLVGRIIVATHRRLHPDADPEPNRISAVRIVDVTSAVQVDSKDDLGIEGLGDWIDEQIISRLPGAGHAAQ
jgi:hypothetical protein